MMWGETSDRLYLEFCATTGCETLEHRIQLSHTSASHSPLILPLSYFRAILHHISAFYWLIHTLSDAE